MGEFVVDINVRASGPVFNGVAKAEAERFSHNIPQIIGDRAVTMIRAYLPSQYMYLGHNGGSPTENPVPPGAGTYQSGIHTDRQTSDIVLVHDTPVVYGPWLEGVGSENPIVWPHYDDPPSRRFPGYHTFRKVAQALDAGIAETIAQQAIEPYIGAMNG